MELFNNREIATAFWLCVGASWALRNSNVRKSVKRLFRVFLNKYILVFTGSIFAYIALMVYGLCEVGLWEFSNLKNTILWTVTSAMVMLFRCQDAQDNPYYFSTLVKDNLKLIIVFEFVVTFYSFGFWVEIVTVPIITIFAMVNAYSQVHKEYNAAAKVSGNLIAIYGVIVMAYTVYRLSIEFSDFFDIDTLREFILPPVMSLLLVPFIYPVVLYMEYERAFIRIQYVVDKRLIPYVKILIPLFFRGNRILLSRWLKINSSKGMSTLKEVSSSFHQIKKIVNDEKTKPHVDFSDGWSPYEARDYLVGKAIKPGNYDPSYDELWFSTSECLPLEDESPVFTNSIAYYISGFEGVAKCLKLVLNVNKPSDDLEARKIFLDFCRTLVERALHENLSAGLEDSIKNASDFSTLVRGRVVSVDRHDWVGRDEGRYELKFKIYMSDFEELSAQ